MDCSLCGLIKSPSRMTLPESLRVRHFLITIQVPDLGRLVGLDRLLLIYEAVIVVRNHSIATLIFHLF